ncbi:transmembrane family of transporters domain-containing protein [Ditylenchus destructor]|uniref:Transmembrane family of transporters domain-containing protein n=1 Tax=Ditylenchus destructor TaxID=166010 RepID=A0AAD4MSB5_9BILA|nr:transmembrane family of transporters domain-containing protein [Ditylenchus destructor]
MSELAIGLAESLISASVFGSSFVLIKKRGIGDGKTKLAKRTGGVSYSVGNALIIPIINEIGMGPAFLLPDTINCIGNFLRSSDIPSRKQKRADLSNFSHDCQDVENIEGNEPELKISVVMPPEKTKSLSDSEPSLWHLFQEIVKRLRRPLFVALALFVGVFYVMCLTTITAMIDSPDVFGYDNPKDSLSYVFSHYTGMFLTSTVIFIGYSICKKNRPNINPEIFLPGFGGGIIWSIAMIFWLLSADNLSQSITGPITAMMPGCVASLWSVFYFKEIEYGKNLYMLCAAITFTLAGSVVSGLSK